MSSDLGAAAAEPGAAELAGDGGTPSGAGAAGAAAAAASGTAAAPAQEGAPPEAPAGASRDKLADLERQRDALYKQRAYCSHDKVRQERLTLEIQALNSTIKIARLQKKADTLNYHDGAREGAEARFATARAALDSAFTDMAGLHTELCAAFDAEGPPDA